MDFPPYPERRFGRTCEENAEEENAQDVPALKESVQLDDPEEKSEEDSSDESESSDSV